MNLTQLIILSFLAVCSIFFHIFACVIFDSWWAMLVILGYVSLPVPMLVFAILRGSSGDRNGLHWAEFATTFFFVNIVGIPFLLYHVDRIESGALVMSLFGTAFAVAAAVAHVVFSGATQDLYNLLMGES